MFTILMKLFAGINFFQGVRGCLKYFWKFRRGGGVNYVLQKWKFRGGGGVHTKFPPWWGYGYFLEPHHTRLSSKMTYVIPKVRTNYGTFNIRFQGAKVWNDISDDLKLLPLKMFKKNLKLILVEKY